MQDLDNNKSFSFRSKFKYSSSSLALFSDDDDDEYNDHEDQNKDSDTDENSFIEIALEHPKIYPNVHGEESDGRRVLQDNLDHLRISFSSSFPASIPDGQNTNVSDSSNEAATIKALSASSSSSSSSLSSSITLSASTLRSSSTGTCRGGAIMGSESFSLYESSRRRDQLPVFNPLVHTLLFSLEAPPETAEEINGRDDRHDNHRRLALIDADNRYFYTCPF